jgi:hypothetical protein
VFGWLRRGHAAAGPAPDVDCECGLYGAATPGLIRPYLGETPTRRIAAQVFGQVSLWGPCSNASGVTEPRTPTRCESTSPTSRIGRARAAREDLAAGLEAYAVPAELLPACGVEAIELVEQKLFSR